MTNEEIGDIEQNTGIKLFQRQGKPLFLNCNCEVKGKHNPIQFELDGGADRTIITRNDASRLNAKIRHFKHSQSIVGVEGRRIECKEYVILKIIIKDREGKNFSLNILCYIFDKNMPNLFGSDIMDYMSAIINYGDNSLTLDGHVVQLTDQRGQVEIIQPTKGKLTFNSKNTMSIPPKQCRQVYVNISDEARIPEGSFALMGDHGGDLLVVDSVWGEKTDNYTMVVFNLSDNIRTVLQGEYLGYVFLAEEGNEIISLDSLISDPVYFTKQNLVENNENFGENSKNGNAPLTGALDGGTLGEGLEGRPNQINQQEVREGGAGAPRGARGDD